MLGIHKSYNGAAAVSYFQESLSKEGNYYLNESIKTYWHGKTAELLGLNGKEVTKEEFSNLVNNIDPNTKERLTVRNAENRRAGYDFTFSAPKSVSVLYGITRDPVLLKAHQTAYTKAIQNIENAIYTQANTQNERGFEKTGNIIYGAFDHFLSRPCEIKKDGKTEYISDPQMHTHVYVPNVTYNERKQRFQAIEVFNVHSNAEYYEALYHSILSHELNKAGYQTRRTHERYEIEGVSRQIIEKFSNRTKLIEETAKNKGITDPKAKAELGVKTRHSKSMDASEIELYNHWTNRLTMSEFKTLHSIKEDKKSPSKSISAKEAIDLSLEHHLERNSVVKEKSVLAYALKLGYGKLLPEDVNTEFNKRDNILSLEQDTVSYITTKEMVEAENKMIEMATSGKGKFRPLNPDYQIKQDFLNEQQQTAVKEILSSKDFVTILKGSAGVGKTSLLTEVQEGINSTGKSLFAVAPSTQASQVLKNEGFEADTIAALLHNPSLQEKLHNNVLVIDEAGMSGVKTMTQLLELSEQYNCQCILSGDTRQHGPPGQYGDAMRILETKAQLKTVSVEKIMRQKPEQYNQAIQKLAKGKTLEGYQILDKMDAIKEIPERDERLEKIADDYLDSVLENRSALIVSPTNIEGEEINQIVRQKLKNNGIVQGEEHEFDTLRNLSFTEAQKKDLVNYREGQVIRFTKNQKGGFKAGSHYEIQKIQNSQEISVRDLKSGETFELPHENPENYQVYNKTHTSLAKGDKIRLTNNSKTLEGTKINNGNTYEIEDFTKEGILLSNGKTISNDLYHFKHAYSETSYSSQGKTSQDVIISMSDHSFAATNEAALYVAASRGTRSVSIYTSDKEDLKKAIIKSNERMTAQEVAEKHHLQMVQRMQREHHRLLNEKLINEQKDLHKGKQPDLNSRDI